MNSEALENVVGYWESVLSDPVIHEMWDTYHTFHGEETVADEGVQSPVQNVRDSLGSLGFSEDSLAPQDAQQLQFLRQFVKTQIRALNKASLLFQKDPEKQNLIVHLKTRLAEIEGILPPEVIERFSKEARNQQRIDGGQAAMLNAYRNWQNGILSDDQNEVLKALQWQTASGSFQPVKSVAGFVSRFVGERVKDPVGTIILTKLVWDSIEFMTDVTGAHQMEIDAAQQADEILAQMGGGLLDIEDLFDELVMESQGRDADDVEAALNARCIEKINTDTNFIGKAVQNYLPESCDAISGGLQNWFAVSTATPRTIQAGQKALSEHLIKQETLAADSYNLHHQNASDFIEKVAYYDNGLHIALLGFGALYGAKLVKKHGVKTSQRLLRGVKQQINLIKERPLTLAGVGGWCGNICGYASRAIFESRYCILYGFRRVGWLYVSTCFGTFEGE